MEAEAGLLDEIEDEGNPASQEGVAGDRQDAHKNVRNHLKPIIINRQHFANKDKVYYRIYTDIDDYKVVEADSAHDAYTKSGVSRAYKIERESFFHYVTVGDEQLEKDAEPIEVSPDLPDTGEGEKLLIDEFLANLDGKYEKTEPFFEIELKDLAEWGAEDAEEEEEKTEASSEEPAVDESEATVVEAEERATEEAEEDLAAAVVEDDEVGDVDSEGELSIDEVTQLLGGKDDDDVES